MAKAALDSVQTFERPLGPVGLRGSGRARIGAGGVRRLVATWGVLPEAAGLVAVSTGAV
jgi:hypothetical protein